MSDIIGETFPVTVIVVGPPPSAVGGIATVVEQMMDLDLGNRFRLEHFPQTASRGPEESVFKRVTRHARHLDRLRATIRRTNASIVHIHTCSGFSFFRSVLDMLVAQRLRCRVILHIHGAAFDEFCARRTRPGRRTISWALSRAERVIALSSSWRETLLSVAPRAKVAIMENAVDVPEDAVKDGRDGPCHLLLLARMDEWKGIDDLLDACRRVHEHGVVFELTLAGPEGTAGDTATLNRKIAARGLEGIAKYVGVVRGNEKDKLLRRADLYVQPSHHEGMPIALLEALAHGLPVVATRVGAVPEVLTDEVHGLLVEPYRPDVLAEALRRLIVDVRRRPDISHSVRELARARFSIARLREDVVNLYNQLNSPLEETAVGERRTRSNSAASVVEAAVG